MKCSHPGCTEHHAVYTGGRPWCIPHIPADHIDPDAVVMPGHYGYESCATCNWPLPARDRNAPEVRYCFACWWEQTGQTEIEAARDRWRRSA